ncbi:MAG: DnaD domain protein [Clostridia bacterium]|nr:DnaD domain protein [Clostridia bacterium]
MKYKINPTELDSSFRVPSSLVDKHIRLANEHQLKVLLWILRNSPENPDIEKMCKALKMNKDDAADYLQYWVLTGVIIAQDGQSEPTPAPVQETAASTPATVPATKAAAPVIAPSKPSSVEIAQRIKESPIIGNLFREAQVKLGKTIGYEGQCTLLMMHDYDGLPVEVIYMLLDYCVSIGKTHNNYIAATGRNWGECEIDTIEKAAERISALRTADRVWKDFAALAGITNPKPTTTQTAYISRWCNSWGFSTDMIYLAYEEMADHTQKLSFAYMDKVLESWHKDAIKTPEDVRALKAAKSTPVSKKADTPAPKASKKQSDTSYDIDAFTKNTVSGNLRYERKKKA